MLAISLGMVFISLDFFFLFVFSVKFQKQKSVFKNYFDFASLIDMKHCSFYFATNEMKKGHFESNNALLALEIFLPFFLDKKQFHRKEVSNWDFGKL